MFRTATCCSAMRRCAALAVRGAVALYIALAFHSVLMLLLYSRPQSVVFGAGLATCPSPIFGKIGTARSGSCICSFSQQGVSLSCTQVTDAVLSEMLNSVDQASVESLKIENANLKQLPPLANMKNALRSFRCRNCGLRGSQLPCNTFKGFKKLRVVDLSENPIESICSTLFTKMLTPEEGAEEEAAPAAGAAPQIVKINLSKTKLKRIPATMFAGDGMEKIGTLDLSGNKLTQPLESGVFSSMTALEELGLSDMNLEEFQESWFTGSSAAAEEPAAADPPPAKHRQLSTKRSLKRVIRQTPPAAEPAAAEEEAAAGTGGGALKKLNLSHNAIRSMRKEDLAPFAAKLEALDLSYNQLKELPSKFLGDFAELMDVSLANNQLKKVPTDTFEGSPKISALSFANNRQLETLPVGLFAPLIGLKELSLANLPKLKSLSEQLFANVMDIDLDVIDLRGTRITNKEAVLQQAKADEGPVEINVSINTV